MDPFERLGPGEEAWLNGTPLQEYSTRLLGLRHWPSAGADGKGVNAKMPDFAAFTEQLACLAGSFNALDALVWAYCFPVSFRTFFYPIGLSIGELISLALVRRASCRTSQRAHRAARVDVKIRLPRISKCLCDVCLIERRVKRVERDDSVAELSSVHRSLQHPWVHVQPI